jgi:hypothetical protein
VLVRDLPMRCSELVICTPLRLASPDIWSSTLVALLIEDAGEATRVLLGL